MANIGILHIRPKVVDTSPPCGLVVREANLNIFWFPCSAWESIPAYHSATVYALPRRSMGTRASEVKCKPRHEGCPNITLIYLYIVLHIFLLCPVAAQGEVVRDSIVEFIQSERLAGRTPDIKRKFGTELWGADFSELDLSGVDLSGAELGSTNFKQTVMVGANLSTSHIYLADFEHANMQKADFTDTKLDRCSLKNADLRGAIKFGSKNSHLGANAQEVNLESTDLTGADLANIDLTNANLSFATLTNASLAKSKLHGANFHHTKVENTIFVNAQISAEERIQLSSKGAIATKSDMEFAVENGVDFTDKNFEGTNFSEFNLNGAILNNARLHSANLTGTQLQKAQLDESFLSYSQVENINLRNAQLKNCTFWWGEFKNADLSHADFTDAYLQGTTFINSNLEGTKFNGANLHEAKFIGCNLKNTNFYGAHIEYTLFENNNGISVKEENRLKSKTSRWLFEIIEFLNRFLEKYYSYLYFFSIISTASLAMFSRKKPIHNNKLWGFATACNLFLLIPLICFALLLLSGTGTVVQFNAGSSLRMEFWSLWVIFFIPICIGSIAVFVVLLISTLVLIVYLLKQNIKGDRLIFISYLISSLSLSFLSLYTLGRFMPTA